MEYLSEISKKQRSVERLMIVAVDFDGTLIEEVEFPQLSYSLLPNASEVIRELHNKGVEFVLCTARYGWYFIPAVVFIKKNKLPIKIFYGKPNADIYIDNKNLGTELIDWLKIKEAIYEKYLLKP